MQRVGLARATHIIDDLARGGTPLSITRGQAAEPAEAMSAEGDLVVEG
jgi:hypothetical protein